MYARPFCSVLKIKAPAGTENLCSPAGATHRLGAGQTIEPRTKKVKHKERSRQYEALQKAKKTAKNGRSKKFFSELCEKPAKILELYESSQRFQNGVFFVSA